MMTTNAMLSFTLHGVPFEVTGSVESVVKTAEAISKISRVPDADAAFIRPEYAPYIEMPTASDVVLRITKLEGFRHSYDGMFKEYFGDCKFQSHDSFIKYREMFSKIIHDAREMIAVTYKINWIKVCESNHICWYVE